MSVAGKDLRALKNDAEQLTSRLPHSSSKDEALNTAIKAAEASMQALKLTKDPIEKSKLSSRVKQLLGEAEEIKSSDDWRKVISSRASSTATGTVSGTATNSRSRVLKEPQSTRELPKKEQILLLKASHLNGFVFPPWKERPKDEDFDLKDGEELFYDQPDLPLSEFQEDVLDDWKRPRGALPPPSWFPDNASSSGPGMKFDRPIDLVQDAATDCSVVASLCAGVARAERGHNKLLRTQLYPYDDAREQGILSKNGKYITRLNFNGCYRKVVIDDRLPTSSTSRVIHVVDRRNPGLLWPALLEKAYLKVRGGYDFPGSNSGTDLWILTGWIPEQVFLQSDDFEPDRLWQRISNSFNFGDVLITMGTGKMSCKTERELGLASEHDYAVLDLREIDGQRLLLIKNPWCEGTSWRGKLNVSHGGRNEEREQESMQSLTGSNGEDQPVQNSRDLLNADDQLSPGTFWMDLDNVIQNFESIYLNWNPGLFSHRQDLHFAWDLAPDETVKRRPRGRYVSLSQHPQYTITAAKGGVVWVLLWRHFQNAVPADATVEEIENDRYGIELKGHMSLIAFSSSGRRVALPEGAVEKGWFVDSPQTVIKLDCKAGEPITLVPAEQELPTTKHTFTISAFSNSSISLAEAKTRYAYTRTHAGSWTKDTAGGNAHSPKYSTNPQYSVTVPRKSGLSILLETANEDIHVHVKLVHSTGDRIHTCRNRDIVFDSKDYRRVCCLAESAEIEPGRYTIICSTFEPQQLSDFTLLVESNQPVQVAPLPREGAGRICLELNPVTFKQGQTKMVAPLIPRRLMKLYAVARRLKENGPSPVNEIGPGNGLPRATSFNLSLLRLSIETGRGPNRRTLVTSNEGEYFDCTASIRMDDIDLSPEMRQHGELWIVLDRICASTEDSEERLSVELFVDQPDSVITGDWEIWDD